MITFYKPPILTIIFRLLGVLALIGAIVAAVVILRQGAAMKGTENAGEAGAYVWTALGTAATGVLVLLFYWGVAQAIDFLGKTAFYTEQMYVQNAARSGVKGKAARATLSTDSYDADDEEPDASPPVGKKSRNSESDSESESESESEATVTGERTKFACTACGQRISSLTSEIGKHIACPNCGEDVMVS